MFFLYNGPQRYEFRYEEPILLKFTYLYLPQSQTEFNFLL